MELNRKRKKTKKKMKISECFSSIQGEGKYTGVPSVFIRTSYCNLRCNWCDTAYTSHRPENKEGTIQEIMDYIEQFPVRFRAPHFVLTGGEPYIQPEQCYDLCEAIKARHPSAVITVETNGTIFAPLNADLISISPKLSSSVPHENQTTRRMAAAHERIRQELKITEFRMKYNCQFKFVVAADTDIREILYIVDAFKIPQNEVYLMPEATTSDQLQSKGEEVVRQCMLYGFNYSDRLHVRIWDSKRGV